MTICRKEIQVFNAAVIDAESKTIRSQQIDCENADLAVVLLMVDKIGTPTSETVVVYPVHVDEEGNEFVDANTTYGTVTITGSNCDIKKAFVIPYLSKRLAVKAVGGSGLSSSTGFKVSARVVLVENTDIPGLYQV